MTARERRFFDADLSVDEVPYSRYERIYLVLAAVFVVLLVLTNVVGIKLFRAPHDPEFALTTGILTYPLTFLATDLVSEIYGKRRADFMVGLGFATSLLMLLVIQVAVGVPPHPAWAAGEAPFYEGAEGYQTAFRSVFALNGVLWIGSMSAYLCAQLVDNYLYHFWKRVTGGRHLWLRNNGSTMISQFVDTLVVNSILFFVGFGMELSLGFRIMATIYVYKLVIAALDTPLVYLGVFGIKRALGVRFHEEVR